MVDKIYWIGGFVICGLALLYKYYRDTNREDQSSRYEGQHGTNLENQSSRYEGQHDTNREDRSPPSVQESNPNRRVLKIRGPLVEH